MFGGRWPMNGMFRKLKETIDWEGIGTLLQNEDPHQRLRGIHNWYYDESHFYDHTRPWVTHVSAQTYFFFNAIKWRNNIKNHCCLMKCVMKVMLPAAGEIELRKEMTSYFWKAGLSGGYRHAWRYF